MRVEVHNKIRKVILSFFIAFFSLIQAVNCFASTEEDLLNGVRQTYETVKNNNGGRSFNGRCGAYVYQQMKALGINGPSAEMANQWYGVASNMSMTDSGYQMIARPGKDSLSQLYNEFGENGEIRNLVIAFPHEYGMSDDNPGAGHIAFIYAIKDSTIYFSESYGSSQFGYQTKEGDAVAVNIDTFLNLYSSMYGNPTGTVYFTKNTAGEKAEEENRQQTLPSEEGWNWNEESGFWRYWLSSGSFAKNQFVDMGRDKKYYFKDDTSLVWGTWYEVDGTWYHAAEDGHADLGWQYLDGEWYYFNDPAGDMKTNGWERFEGKKYYLSGSGARYRNTTQNIEGKTYTFDDTGVATEVKKKRSSITVSGASKPGNLYVGDYFGLMGTVKSEYIITELTGKITGKNGTVIQEKTVYPGSETYDLSGEINNSLIFNDLATGQYYYIVTAMDSDGYVKEVIKKSFTVKEKAKASSTLKISNATKPSKIKAGDFFGLSGTVSSNYIVTEVRGEIQDSKGNVIQEKTVYPNSYSYDLDGEIDNSLIFNYLSKGSYRYIITATDTSGKTKKLINASFKVIEK